MRPHSRLQLTTLSTLKAEHSFLFKQPQFNINKQMDNYRSTRKDQPPCIIEFDGASKGNPGRAGAGAVLRTVDGSVAIHLREGVGNATNNVAEYRAVNLGMKKALENGFTEVRVQGDSDLVCKQMQGHYKVKSQNLTGLHQEAQELKSQFKSFDISHIPRGQNSAADAQANRAVNLGDGHIEEQYFGGTHHSEWE